MTIGRDMILAIKLYLDNKQYKPALDQAVSDTQNAAQRMSTAHGLSAQEMQGEAGKLIAKLKEQNDTFNMSANELRRYRAAQIEMSDAQRAATNALLSNLEAMEAQTGSSAGGLRALAAGSSVATAGVAVLAAAALTVGMAYHQAQQETLAYEKAIILSGNAAGVTSGQLADMARRIDGVAGTQANAAAALASMTAGGKVAQENLEKVALAAIEMERATGQSIGETEKIFSSLGKDPVKASLRLNESMNYLTASTYAQMKAADELGDTERAASIAQNAAADALRDRAAKVEKNLGTMERAWRGVRDLAKEAWDAMLNVGREQSSGEKLEAVRKRISELEGKLAANAGFGETSGGAATGRPVGTARMQAELAGLQAQAAALEGVAYQARESANAERERGEAVKAAITLSEGASKHDSALEKTRKAIAQATQQYTAAIKNEGLTQQERAQIDANYLKIVSDLSRVKERGAGASKAELSEYDKLVRRLGVDVPKAAAEAEAAQHGYNKAQTEFLVLAGSPAWVKFTNEQRASAAAQFEKKIASEQAADAIKDEEKATVEATKAREKSLATAEKELEKLRASVVAQEEQNARLGLSKEAIAELDAAKLEMLATDAEMQAANALFLNQNGELFLVLQKQAKAYRDLAQAKRDGAAKQVDVDREKQIEDVAGKAAKEGEKAAERIEQSLTDSLMRGFEAGKDMARNLRDTVVNMFKTMVLRPMVSAVFSPVAGAITGAMGLASAGQSGGGSAASTAMSAASLFGSFTTAGMLPTGIATALTGSTSSLAMGLSGAWGAGGGMLSTLNAGMSMLGSGSIMSGLGTLAGALGPIAIGIAALAAIFGKKATPHAGAASTYSEAGGLVSNADIYRASGLADVRTYNAGVEQVTGNVAKAIGDTLNSTAKAFGQTAGYEITTAFADDTSKDGAWGSLIIKQMGEAVIDWRDTQTSKWAPKEFADGEAGSKEYLAEVAKSARDALVQAVGSVDWAADMLKGLGDTVSLESLAQTVQQISAAKAAFVGFGQYMGAFAAQSDAAVSALVKASGGAEALAGNMSAFVDAYYTDAEKLAVNTANVRTAIEALGLQMPATKTAMRDMVKEQIALGTEGATAAAGLLAVSGAFGQLQDAASALRTALGGAFDQLAQSLDSMHGDVSKADKRVADARMEIWSGYADAQQRVIDLEMQAAEATRGFAQSLRGFVSDLATGPGSSMGLESRYRALQQQFQQTAAQAGAGDQGARDRLTGVASSYLDASRSRSRTSVDYARDEARVRVMLGNMATVAESDPLVQKYDAESLSIQQQIADAQVDVVKYLALMEATGTSTDLGIQTVDKTLAALRDEYMGAAQAQAAANLRLDVALAALDALGLTEEMVKAIAASQTNSLSAALNVSDEALASITGALGLTPENVAELGQQFAVEVALLVGQAATDLAATLQGALAFDPSQYNVLRGVLGYDPAIIAPLATALGLSPEAVQQLASQIALQDGAAELLARVADGLPLSPDAAQALQAAAEGVGLSAGAADVLGAMRAGLGLTPAAAQALGAALGGIGMDAGTAARIDAIAAGVGLTEGASIALGTGVALTEGAAGALGAGVGLSAGAADALIAGVSMDAATTRALGAGLALSASAAIQVQGLLDGIGIMLTPQAADQVQGLLDGLKLAPADLIAVEGMLAGIGFTPETREDVALLMGGIGLRAGVLQSLSTALGLSPEAAAALSLMGGVGSIDSMVKTAYGSIGRSGFGDAVSEIDSGGFDYWKSMLSTGRVGMDEFLPTFLSSAAEHARENGAYAEYVAPYLKKLGLPGFAVGTNYVPQDMLAQIHKGEAIVPAPFNPAAFGGMGNADVVAELRVANERLSKLQTELEAQRRELQAIKTASSTTATGMTGIVNKQVTLVTEAA